MWTPKVYRKISKAFLKSKKADFFYFSYLQAWLKINWSICVKTFSWCSILKIPIQKNNFSMGLMKCVTKMEHMKNRDCYSNQFVWIIFSTLTENCLEHAMGHDGPTKGSGSWRLPALFPGEGTVFINISFLIESLWKEIKLVRN